MWNLEATIIMIDRGVKDLDQLKKTYFKKVKKTDQKNITILKPLITTVSFRWRLVTVFEQCAYTRFAFRLVEHVRVHIQNTVRFLN